METRRTARPSRKFSLSENQCGMETSHPDVRGCSGIRVEREPMWDGNLAVIEMSRSNWAVEREPMWDGNLLGSTAIMENSCVEREPMWDGNLRAPGEAIPPIS